jgi:PilZ domain
MVSHMAFGKREPTGYRGVERRGGIDRREAARQRSPVRARIILSSGQIVRCSIKDISKNGAMICVQSILGLPELFELERDGTTCQVKVMRREATRLAVKFL